MCLNASRVIVLDLDGAIGTKQVFTENGFRAVDQLAYERWGIRGFADQCHHAGPLTDGTDFFDRVLSEVLPSVSNDVVQEFLACFQEHQPTARLAVDTIRVLKQLSRFCLLVVLADGPFAEQKAKCASLGLEKYVHRVVYPDYWGRAFWLPHPRALMSIQNCHGLEPARCTFVADRQHKGFAVAQRLGWQTIRMLKSGGPGSHDSVDRDIADLWDLCRVQAAEAAA